MNSYNFTVQIDEDEDQNFELEASKASLNYKDGFIEAVVEPGHFKVIRLPEGWTSIETKETLGPEEQAAYEEAMKQQQAMEEAQRQQVMQQMGGPQQEGPPVPPMAPGAPVPPVVPPGQ